MIQHQAACRLIVLTLIGDLTGMPLLASPPLLTMRMVHHRSSSTSDLQQTTRTTLVTLNSSKQSFRRVSVSLGSYQATLVRIVKYLEGSAIKICSQTTQLSLKCTTSQQQLLERLLDTILRRTPPNHTMHRRSRTANSCSTHG